MEPTSRVLVGLRLKPCQPLGEFLKEQELSQSVARYRSDLQMRWNIPELKCFE